MITGDPLWDYAGVVKARHLGGTRVWLRFEDGLEGELDLADRLRGPIFEPLRDPKVFARFKVDHTLCWPNGADISPEFLWDRVRFEKLGIKPSRRYPAGFLRKSQLAPYSRSKHKAKPAVRGASKKRARGSR